MTMIKVIPPGSQQFNEQIAQMIKVSNDGLRGEDLRSFIKRAGHSFAKEAKNLEFKKGEVPIHLLALGCTELYSANRNFDGFTKQALRNYHNTFVKHARFYRDHANKDRSKSYGIVKASTFNEPMGRVELIVALNGTKQAAEANGGLVADKEIEKLNNNGDIPVSMACVVNPDALVLTADGYKRIEDVTTRDKVYTHNRKWRNVKEVNRRIYTGEVVHLKVKGLPVKISLTADHPMYAKLLSKYPKEIKRQKTTTVWKQNVEAGLENPFEWFHADHLSAIDKLECCPITNSPNEPVNNVELCKVMGKNASNTEYCDESDKHIPLDLFGSSEKCKYAFLDGWLESNGWIDKKGICWTDNNLHLILQGRDLLLSLGIPSTIFDVENKKHVLTPNELKAARYILKVASSDAVQSDHWVSVVPEEYVKSAFPMGIQLVGTTSAYTIYELRREQVTDIQTYNIEVEEDESYMLYGITSHNCKVAYDVCSYCGNKAKNRSEYCTGIDEGGMCKAGGLKNNIGKVLSDGRMLFADNPYPDFFDISNVFRGADRCAYVFGKIASNKTGAELAEELNLTLPYEILMEGLDYKTAGCMKSLHQLSEAETRLEKGSVKTGSFVRSFDPDIQVPIILEDAFNNRYNVLNGLANQKIALSLKDFLSLATGESLEKCAEVSIKASEYLPQIFTRLTEDPNLEMMLQNNPFKSSGDLASQSQIQWAAKYAQDYSLNRDCVNHRVLRSALHNQNAPLIKSANFKPKSTDSRFMKAATLYALYKVNLLYDITKSDSDSEYLSDLMVQQNYV